MQRQLEGEEFTFCNLLFKCLAAGKLRKSSQSAQHQRQKPHQTA